MLTVTGALSSGDDSADSDEQALSFADVGLHCFGLRATSTGGSGGIAVLLNRERPEDPSGDCMARLLESKGFNVADHDDLSRSDGAAEEFDEAPP